VTAHPELYTPRRLEAAGRQTGIRVECRVPARGRRDDRLRGGADATLLARPGTFSLLSVLREHRRLAALGARPLQSRRALLDACDQARTLERAREAGLPTPPTALLRRPAELRPALERIPGPPWFVKGRRGSQGTQVLLARNQEEAARAGLLFWGAGASCLLQQDLRGLGCIERHLVVFGRVLACAIARPAPGEHRSNLHRGGTLEAIEPEGSSAAALALAARSALDLPFVAVDAIGEREPVLLEVNASPGLFGLERATGRNLALPLLAALLSLPTCCYAPRP
jgi:ribosomal protein S6--L-glutamate ligase